ncbi:MAG TPA: AMIN domain-containing protein, partial [Candidatus Sulfotelmatobacter sp.]|nr:AMIN domain-containing protein [Candidatus Sulfotelmatobacter sp.]
MNRSARAAAGVLVWAAILASATLPGRAQNAPTVRRVQVLGNRNPIEIEIEGSDPLVPEAQVLTGPDRLVVDFANAVPAAQLHNQTLNRADVKSVRVGLFAAKPPVTRVVFDLNGPQAYQLFPSGRTVIIKVGSAGAKAVAISSPGPRLVNTNYPAQSAKITPPPPPPPLIVSFQAGMLTITANKASLSEVLFAVHQHTGAEIAIPAGAEQEQVVAQIGPASAPEVLAHLLNGSRFNFLILSSASNPATLDRVILSARPDGPAPAFQPLPQVVQAIDDPEPEVPARTQAPPPPAPIPGAQANPQPD